MVTFPGNKLIVSADYGNLDDTDMISCIVKYADGSSEHITTKEGLQAVAKQLELQAKSFQNK